MGDNLKKNKNNLKNKYEDELKKIRLRRPEKEIKKKTTSKINKNEDDLKKNEK